MIKPQVETVHGERIPTNWGYQLRRLISGRIIRACYFRWESRDLDCLTIGPPFVDTCCTHTEIRCYYLLFQCSEASFFPQWPVTKLSEICCSLHFVCPIAVLSVLGRIMYDCHKFSAVTLAVSAQPDTTTCVLPVKFRLLREKAFCWLFNRFLLWSNSFFNLFFWFYF